MSISNMSTSNNISLQNWEEKRFEEQFKMRLRTQYTVQYTCLCQKDQYKNDILPYPNSDTTAFFVALSSTPELDLDLDSIMTNSSRSSCTSLSR